MKQIVAFDFDMTLFDHASWSIPDSTKLALEILHEKQIIVALATGRDMDNYYSRVFLDNVKADARIEQNGAKIVADNKLIYNHLMDKKLLKDILEFCKLRHYSVGFTIGDDDYYINEDVIRKNDIDHWGECGRNFKDPELLPQLDVRTLAFIGSIKQADDLCREFPQIKIRMFAGLSGGDLMEKNISKAEGLNMLCRHYGVDIIHTFSFGDSMNDYEILKAAGFGIAMGNACDELKNAADYVTDRIDADGIWNGLKYYNLI